MGVAPLGVGSPPDPSAPDRAAGFTYSFDCGDGAGFNAFGATTSRTCVGVVGTTYTVRGRIRDKDGGIRTYSAKIVFTLSPAGQIEPQIDAQSLMEVKQVALAPPTGPSPGYSASHGARALAWPNDAQLALGEHDETTLLRG